MTPTVLALNAGSSSVKFGVFGAQGLSPKLIFKGLLDKHSAKPRFSITGPTGEPVAHDAELDEKGDWPLSLIEQIEALLGDKRLSAVGHRIVHGGPDYSEPKVINSPVLADLEKLTPLAPLHQPHCLAAVRALMAARPAPVQTACFDTAFHRDMDPVYQRFPLPDLAPGIRRYGFHGLSFEYIAGQIDEPDVRAVVAHLGGGSSVCAMRNGKSVNTSMSLTPLDGLIMATRCGAVDPGLLLYLQKSKAMSVTQLEDILYKKSGVLALSGLSSDMRILQKKESNAAAEAIRQFCMRAAEEIAVMITSLRGVDLIIFTGGIGENSPTIRRDICANLQWLGLDIDQKANELNSDTISTGSSRVQVRAIPTSEEAIIAKHTLSILSQAQP